MIYIVIEGSCCGKTSFCKNTWLQNKSFKIKKDIIYYTETEDVILIGKYSNIDSRERSGTDTISRSQIHLIKDQVEKLILTNKDIILEGDNVVSRKLFESLIQMSDITLILVNSYFKKSLDRNRRNNSSISDSTLKAICTKAENIFNEYKHRMNGIYIDTTYFTIDDFKSFNLYNYINYINTKNEQLTFFDL